MTVTADHRLLARFDTDTGQWRTSEGAHTIAVGRNAQDLVLDAKATLGERAFGM